MSKEQEKQNKGTYNEVDINDLVNLYEEEEELGNDVEELDLETLYQEERPTKAVEGNKVEETKLEEGTGVKEVEENPAKSKEKETKKGLLGIFKGSKRGKGKEEEKVEITKEDEEKQEEVQELLALMETDNDIVEELEEQKSEDDWDIELPTIKQKEVKVQDEYKETDEERRTRIKRKRIFLGTGILSTAVGLYLVFHIIVWWQNNKYNGETLGFIKDTEVVGVAVDPTAGLSVDAKEVDIQLAKTYPFIDVDFKRLKERNKDTVAWLKVGAVNLDIPIVQTIDNDYYLTHDFDGNVNALGWVFADARSNMESTGFNTVLYGHNAATRTMFGSLKGLLEIKDEEMREANEIIQMNTVHTKGVYEIVSVYITEYTDWEYVQQSFGGTEDKQKFIDRMREKNTVKMFDRDDLTTSDRFLTFSTCHGPAGTDDRLVVVARLIAEK